MSIFAGDAGSRSGGWLSRVDGRTKFFYTAGMLGVVLAAREPPAGMACAALSAALMLTTGKGLRVMVMRALPAALVGGALFLVYSMSIGVHPVGHVFGIAVYEEGAVQGARLFWRILGAVAATVVLVETTPVSEFIALARWLRLPAVLVEIMGLAYRFTFLLFEELGRIQDAMGARLGFARGAPRMRNMGLLAGNLFIRAYERSGRVYTAMRARGYVGQARIPRRWSMGAGDLPALAFFLSLLGAFAWYFLVNVRH